MTWCPNCARRPVEPGKAECFHCRVASVGFTFRGASYGQRSFNDSTIAEKRAEILGDRVLGVDVEPVSTFGG